VAAGWPSRTPPRPSRWRAAAGAAGRKSGPTTVYAITSLTAAQASPAAIIPGHWMIEDQLHWVRHLDFDEDRSQIRTASAPQVMAAMRNLAITILRLAGYASIATRTSPPRPQAGPAPTDDHELLMLTLPRP